MPAGESHTWPGACLPVSAYRTAGMHGPARSMRKIEDLLQGGKATTFEIFQQVALEDLDEAVAVLKRHKPADEVRNALTTLIGMAPLAQFQVLSAVYRKHCG